MEDPKKSDAAVFEEEWPNSFRTREELDALLEEGLNSRMLGEPGDVTFDRVLKRLRNG